CARVSVGTVFSFDYW
nr:immunoglobulin heavy chain junction region [Macaca mulatta]MOY26137.1 immunoglobulin heavy chain junction region [Macaca mulatta]MOY26712.1 immunoglobulin heavy chain junction region [Macaca mulatta]MOY28346.1 immunoglobulin heavy chain junction region [Macaca mulatta]MOY28518.1 immunoglobulin heavy chain junction region [Macaca mulatta]